MKVSFERRLILFFTIIFLGIIILGIVAYKSNRTTLETNKLIDHTKDVIAESELVLSLSKDIVMGSQRYVITGDSSFLGPFPTSRKVVKEHVDMLRGLIGDNPAQQMRVDSLAFIMQNRINFSDLYIKIRSEEGFDAASKMIGSGRGKFYTDQIRELVNRIEGYENFLLIERQKENNESIAAFNRAFYALLICVFIFLAVIFFYILYNFSKREKAEDDLRQSEEQIQAVFRGAPDAVIAIDSTGTIVNWNPKAEALFGWKANEVKGKLLSDTIIPHRFREAHQKGMKHYLKTGVGPVLNKTIEIQAINKENAEFDVALSISPTLVKDGYLFIGFIRDITEKKKIEEEMKQTNYFLDTILENIPNMIFVKDADELRFVRFNKAGETLLGYSRKDLIGKNDYDFFPKEQADFFTKKDKDVIEKGDLLDIPEEPINTANGERFLHTKKIPISDEHGNPLYLLGISEDITERKKAEELLKDLNERFLKIFNLSPVPMSISVVEDGRFVQVNEAFEKLFLLKQEEIVGKVSSEVNIINLEDRNEKVKELTKRGGHVKGLEMKLRRKNGEIIDVLTSSEVMEIDHKKCFLTAFTDITERKIAEQRLKDLNEQFLTIFNLSPIAMSISNIDDARITRVNESFERLFMIKKEDAYGRSFDELRIREGGRAKLLELIQSQGGQVREMEMKLRKTNGEMLDALVSIESIMINNKSSLISVAMDISRRKKAEEQIIHLNSELGKNIEQLKAVNKELEAFSYSVSHDLRAPLRIINGYAEILLQDCKDKMNDEERKNFNVIKENADKMGRLIDDLLNFSRLGRKELVIHEVDMDKLVANVISEQHSHNPAHPVEIKKAPLLPATCDHSLMQQVWTNLISNAIKYSGKKEKSQIEIGSYEKDNAVVYFIKDNGVGFDMHYVEKLFGVFQRLHKMTEFEGSGVGLAIVQRIVVKHGGKVWAEAEVGKGATFYFSLPVLKQVE